VGFVTCDPEWAEIVFLASQWVLYDYFGNETGEMDLNLNFDGALCGEVDRSLIFPFCVTTVVFSAYQSQKVKANPYGSSSVSQ
jgi:hypothetical protein